jgi:hypothetical protein
VHPCHILDHLLNGWGAQQAAHCGQWPHLLRRTSHLWQRVSDHHWFHQWYRLRMGKGQAIADEQDVTSYYPTRDERQFAEYP